MGKDRRILIAIVLLGLVALCASGDRAHAVSAVQTSTVTSGQVPTATQWNTYLNRAENWINSNLLGSGTTFTFAEGESLLVNGTIVIDSIRVTGFFDLAAHILPRTGRMYHIGLPTRLLGAIYSDTVDGQHVAADSLTATIITGRTTTSGFGLFPVTTGTDTLGRPTKRFQAVHSDTGRFVSLGDTVTKVGSGFSLEPATNSTATIGVNGKRFDSVNADTVRHTVAFDSNDVSKIAPSDVDTLNAAWQWAGRNIAPTLPGAHEWTGTQKFSSAGAIVLKKTATTVDTVYGFSAIHPYDAVVDSAGGSGFTTVDAAIDGGAKSIFIKNGTYPAFTADVAGLRIEGESWKVWINGSTPITAADDVAITVSATNVWIKNLSASTDVSGAGTQKNCIAVLTGGDEAILENIYVRSSDNQGIYVVPPRCKILNCYTLSTDDNGIYLDPTADNSIVMGCHVKDAAGSSVTITAACANVILSGLRLDGGTVFTNIPGSIAAVDSTAY